MLVAALLAILCEIHMVEAVSFPVFTSRDAIVRQVISECEVRIPGPYTEQSSCYSMLDCIGNRTSTSYAMRWNAGASILSFLPTIAGLMSNSIEDLLIISEESTLMAVLLSFSSVTAFSHRFQGRNTGFASAIHSEPSESKLHAMVADSMTRLPVANTGLWRREAAQKAFASCAILISSGWAWFMVYEIARYGVTVFACPIKYNALVWVGLAHLLSVFNIIWRRKLFERHSCTVGNVAGSLHSFATPAPASFLRKIQDLFRRSKRNTTALKVVLRSPRRHSLLAWMLQTLTSITSYSLYTYGTVVLASVTLIPASDAVRAMTTATVSAGVGRLVGHWFLTATRPGRSVMLVEVPAGMMGRFVEMLPKEMEVQKAEEESKTVEAASRAAIEGEATDIENMVAAQ